MKAEQATRRQVEERVSVVEQELKDVTRKCKSLEEENIAKATRLTKALVVAKEARSESRAAREEVRDTSPTYL